jgi:DNA-binding CsgD family transcriptional regulator
MPVNETSTTRAAPPDPSPDPAVRMLQMQLRLHAVGCAPVALHAALNAWAEWLSCSGPLAESRDARLGRETVEPVLVEALAGRVTHCAMHGTCPCGGAWGDRVGRSRCAALAPHLHQAATAARNAQRAALIDLLPPTWILDRSGNVLDANAAAGAITAATDAALTVTDGRLAPAIAGGGARLYAVLRDLDCETHFSWPDHRGDERTLLLRPLSAAEAGLAASLLPEPPTLMVLAAILGPHFKLTSRQSTLAAHLLAGWTLSDAARAMSISRQTATEHLAALLRLVGARDRKALLIALRRAAPH